MTRLPLTVSAEHPAYDGHFPGAPVLPGAVLLDEVIAALESSGPGGARPWRITVVKFSAAVRPGEPLELEHEPLENGAIRFRVLSGERTVATGMLART
jgi:3-hydroxymyristoyl/3-hydroxydecanoyl-(acyl carrier protein) dehydratase